mmetsp:Transcript_2619/g.7211  ORF Transcript_2619/g.7211 Transcript_2619/m.7211 type:complete len:218 (-) Transcript_2619:209-862(-)
MQEYSGGGASQHDGSEEEHSSSGGEDPGTLLPGLRISSMTTRSPLHVSRVDSTLASPTRTWPDWREVTSRLPQSLQRVLRPKDWPALERKKSSYPLAPARWKATSLDSSMFSRSPDSSDRRDSNALSEGARTRYGPGPSSEASSSASRSALEKYLKSFLLSICLPRVSKQAPAPCAHATEATSALDDRSTRTTLTSHDDDDDDATIPSAVTIKRGTP